MGQLEAGTRKGGGAPMVDGRHIFSSLTNSVGVYIPINKDSYLRWDKFIPNIYIYISYPCAR